MLFAQLYPTEENGNASTDFLTLGDNSSLKYANLVTLVMLVLSSLTELFPEAWPVLECAVKLGNH